MKRKTRDYKKENEKALENNIRINMKVPKKYQYILEEIKEKEGLTKFFINNLKNYENTELSLSMSETASLMAIVENYLVKYSNLDNKYLEEIRKLEKKIKKYYDYIFGHT